jgi:hypothetical protein
MYNLTYKFKKRQTKNNAFVYSNLCPKKYNEEKVDFNLLLFEFENLKIPSIERAGNINIACIILIVGLQVKSLCSKNIAIQRWY